MEEDKNQRRVRGVSVTPEVEVLVASVYKEHPKWTKEEIRNIVIGEISRRPSLYFSKGIPPKISVAIKEGNLEWPGISKIHKLIAPIKDKLAEPSEEDDGWCMGRLKPPMSPETVLAVLKVWKLSLARGEWLTVREAKWAALLSKLAKDTKQLYWQAREYAYYEYLYELVGRPFDSSTLDMFYMKIPLTIIFSAVEDEQQRDFMFIPEIVSEGLEDKVYEPFRGKRLLAIAEPQKDIEAHMAEAKKIDREWEAYKKEAQDEG